MTGIDPFHPLRPALPERDALQRVFREVRHAVQGLQLPARDPRRSQRVVRSRLPQRGGGARGDQAQSLPSVLVLRHRVARGRGARADRARESRDWLRGSSGIRRYAHSASYDAERSADIFCHVSNRLTGMYREAEARACALGWHEVAPADGGGAPRRRPEG